MCLETICFQGSLFSQIPLISPLIQILSLSLYLYIYFIYHVLIEVFQISCYDYGFSMIPHYLSIFVLDVIKLFCQLLIDSYYIIFVVSSLCQENDLSTFYEFLILYAFTTFIWLLAYLTVSCLFPSTFLCVCFRCALEKPCTQIKTASITSATYGTSNLRVCFKTKQLNLLTLILITNTFVLHSFTLLQLLFHVCSLLRIFSFSCLLLN